jgi:hypothetical protein
MSDPIVACPQCGFAGGRAACQDLFHDVALRVRELAWTGSLRTWRVMHDVYFVQHEEEYCGRYKGLVMHLGGLCWALEHGGQESGYRALQKLVEKNPWNGLPYPPPPGIPTSRGSITVGSLRDLDEPDRLTDGVDRWARATWLAFAALQPIAREWVEQALKKS